jgi:hypothetical protein
MLDTPIAGQYKAKENAYRENSNLGNLREENLAGSNAGRATSFTFQLAHNDAVVHGLNPADNMEISRASMAHKQRC